MLIQESKQISYRIKDISGKCTRKSRRNTSEGDDYIILNCDMRGMIENKNIEKENDYKTIELFAGAGKRLGL